MSALVALNWFEGTTFCFNPAGDANANAAVAVLGVARWWGIPPGNDYREDYSGLHVVLPSPHDQTNRHYTRTGKCKELGDEEAEEKGSTN